MSVNIAAIDNYTDAEIVKVLRSSLVSAAIAQNYSIGGKQLNRASVGQIQQLIEIYEARVQAASDSTGGNDALVIFGDRR